MRVSARSIYFGHCFGANMVPYHQNNASGANLSLNISEDIDDIS
jgi:hypothetical protein